jgi:site-specific DNA-methyltransferase (adenine-specific)
MATMEENSVDSIVTDPPYGLSFMGKDWDHGIPGIPFWKEALRVAKPGTYLLAFGGTRTFHRLACAIEDAGWEIRDTLMWVYGSGFPKSLDVSKAIDRAAGAEREVIGKKTGRMATPIVDMRCGAYGSGTNNKRIDCSAITAPSTPAAIRWQGWGTALKPAWEPIIMARKPLSEKTVAANVLKWGTGAINIDGCRIGATRNVPASLSKRKTPNAIYSDYGGGVEKELDSNIGRWPANLIHDGSDEVMEMFPNNTARFFYCAKASRKERNMGCEDTEKKMLRWSSGDQSPGTFQSKDTDKFAQNNHPCVKPLALMRYLIRLVTPPGGNVLDPFVGSGTTCIAAEQEGHLSVGIEKDKNYYEIAQKRCFSLDKTQKMCYST